MIMRPFWQLEDDLFIENACITWKDKFFILAVLKSKCLKTFLSMNWATINKEIADYVQLCVPCQTISNFQQKVPAI